MAIRARRAVSVTHVAMAFLVAPSFSLVLIGAELETAQIRCGSFMICEFQRADLY